MTRKRSKGSSGGRRHIPNVSRAHGVVKKLLDNTTAGGDQGGVEDPRFQNLSSKTVSRKERRKRERQAKKERIRAFHSRKKNPETTVPSNQPSGKPPRKQAQGTEAVTNEEDATAKAEAARKKRKEAAAKKREKRKEKQAKALEERRKRDLLEANELEDRNIKRLEKSLRFRKKKKTREVILPAQFKYDGLDSVNPDLLDVVDAKKLEALREDEQELSEEIDQAKERQKNLARDLDDSDQDHGEDDMEDSSDEDDNWGLGGALGDESGDEGGRGDVSGGFGDVTGGMGESRSSAKEVESDSTSGDGDDGDGPATEYSAADNRKRDLTRGRGGTKTATKPTGVNKKEEKKEKMEEGSKSGKRKDQIQEMSDDSSSEVDSGLEDEVDEQESPGRKRKLPPKMDPYGRMPGERGDEDGGSYIPPHKRAAMMGQSMDDQRKAELEKLRRQLKGLINRLSLSNLSFISKEIEGIYLTKSRNDMNETLCDIIQEALVNDTMSGERLVMEVVLLIAVLHCNVGSEVGAHFLQSMAVRFDQLHRAMADVGDKSCDNALLVLIHLYNFKIVHCCLIYDIIRRLVEGFTEQDIEMLLMIMKSAGMSLRKDDPLALKEIILSIQAKAASSTEELKQQSRVRFMLDTITALRNNDIRKMAANSNMEHLDTLRKTLKNLTKNREHSAETNLRIPLDDLLLADQKGRWWIVGSAWTGHGPNRGEKKATTDNPDLPRSVTMDHSTSKKIMELSRQQRMNTDLRRSIFGLIMTAEDYQDCFSKLLQIAVKNKQEKECVLVLIDCCQQERQFNPYYAYVLAKLCLFERKFRIACQFAYWDRFKILDQLKKSQINNLACLFSHLLLSKASSLAVLKVIEFADMDKNTAVFLKKLLMNILSKDTAKVRMVFEAVSGVDKLNHLRDTISLFLHHFILKQRGTRTDDEQSELKGKIGAADRALKGEKEGKT